MRFGRFELGCWNEGCVTVAEELKLSCSEFGDRVCSFAVVAPGVVSSSIEGTHLATGGDCVVEMH